MAPTYPIGGSDFSYTRQGGINFILMKLAAMVFALLDGIPREERNQTIPGPAFAGHFIDLQEQFSIIFTPFRTPKVMRKS
jgi:hypothetical protein